MGPFFGTFWSFFVASWNVWYFMTSAVYFWNFFNSFVFVFMTCYFCNFCYFQNFLELNFRWLFWSKATVFLCFFLLLGDLFLAHFSFFLHFFECLVLSDICCVFLELLLISTDFTHYSVVVRFGPIMEFFLRLLPLSSIFGEMFYIFLGGFFRKLCWTFLGHFCTFLECFILFSTFWGLF